MTRVPFLYHFVLGKLSVVRPPGVDGTLWLRLINVVLSMMTVFLAYRLAQRLVEDWPTRILFLVMVTNTLMFTFIGAAVSYDNLTNLLAVAGLAALFGFLRSGRPRELLALLVWLLLGSLTKVSFLPLAMFLGMILLLDRRGRILTDIRGLVVEIRSGKPSTVALAIVGLVVLAANLWLYGGNLVRYGKPVPACQQVLDLEACMENRIFARNWIVAQYRDGETTLDEAIRATTKIDHAGDRDHAIRLLRNEVAYKESNPELLPVLDYMDLIWGRGMKPAIFGIQAHVSMLKPPSALLPYNLILLAAFLLWVRGCTWGGAGRSWVYLGGLSLAYFVFLAGMYLYSGYLVSHAPFLGVQGRYIFPVLVPACLVTARFLLGPFREAIRVALLVVVSAVFIYGDLPYFLRHAGDAWFGAAGSVSAEPQAQGLERPERLTSVPAVGGPWCSPDRSSVGCSTARGRPPHVPWPPGSKRG
ncbi:MAG: DUF2142 domain-containing protein [Acidobacteria bacterium]|nr:DUF2142 domain-containing protein [Acidobacteriota bacterium]NIM63296.1 DUF2142 domain-containing protein [Acidobacteriota bacterium]NIO59143.1 DUF2142 domain-containing protein [Acidobacteriota bacterium]NIQ30175.1 DUF2142 domain-containing protein [Acidobacteriota bacterium]NIQ85043.1 DUF2142 domain-containing protein [Acidobacteriota bacterium]